jgi:sialidase-1
MEVNDMGIEVKVVPDLSTPAKAVDCREMLVGPGVNQPDPYPGYGGFVGWTSPLLLKSGDMIVGFSAGYWHGSPPTPPDIDPDTLESWIEMGFPRDFDAPTGGRAMFIRSTDRGRTWSKPETLIDTPDDDRHPNFIELDDGTILCSFFTYGGRSRPARTRIVRSFDGGCTWEQEPTSLPSPFAWDATDGPFIALDDGSAMLSVYGGPTGDDSKSEIGLFTTTDSGDTWELRGTVSGQNEMSEPGVAQLPDGKLVMMTRPEGDVAFSGDRGATWSEPSSFGMRMYEAGLLCLDDGTLLCLHGTYNKEGESGIRGILSADGGRTWVAPAATYGFEVDPSVYGYTRGIKLPDGSVYLAYIGTGGHGSEDARTMAIWSLRIRVRPDLSGIDVLPPTGW